MPQIAMVWKNAFIENCCTEIFLFCCFLFFDIKNITHSACENEENSFLFKLEQTLNLCFQLQ